MQISCQRKFFGVDKKQKKILSVYVLFCLIFGLFVPTSISTKVPEKETVTGRPSYIHGNWKQSYNIQEKNLEELAEKKSFLNINSTFPDTTLNIIEEKEEEEEEENENDVLINNINSSTVNNLLNEGDNNIVSTTLIEVESTQKIENSNTNEQNQDNTEIINEEIENQKNSNPTSTEEIGENIKKEKKDKKEKEILDISMFFKKIFRKILIPNFAFASSTPETKTTSTSSNIETEELEETNSTIQEITSTTLNLNDETISTTESNTEQEPLTDEKYTESTQETIKYNGETANTSTEKKEGEKKMQNFENTISTSTFFNTSSSTTSTIFTTNTSSTLLFSTSTTSTEPVNTSSTENLTETQEEELSQKNYDFPEKYLEIRNFQILGSYANSLSTPVENARLGLSMTFEKLPGQKLIFYYKEFETDIIWKKFKTINLNKEYSNYSNKGYLFLSFHHVTDLLSLKNTQIKIVYEGNTIEPLQPIMIDAIWVEADTIAPGIKSEAKENIFHLISQDKNFDINEDIYLVFDYDKEKIEKKKKIKTKVKNIIQKTKNKINEKQADEQKKIIENIEITIFDSKNSIISDIEPKIVGLQNNVFSVVIDKKFRKIKPGKYTVELKLYQEDEVISQTEDFTLGILAINTNKYTYTRGENVYLQMASLDEQGNTLCDSNLDLKIIDPNGTEKTMLVRKSDTCLGNNVTSEPDYYSYYIPENTGIYYVKLKNLDTDKTTETTFKVRDKSDFILERIGPTRIYPLADYQMNLKISFNRDFSGYLRELVPENFFVGQINVLQTKGAYYSKIKNIEVIQGVIENEIKIQGDWHAGDEYHISYVFDAPNISPYLFLLGPVKLEEIKISTSTITEMILSTSTVATSSTTPTLSFTPPTNELSSTTTIQNETEQTIKEINTSTYSNFILKEKIIETTSTEEVYIEGRQWFLASDAVEIIEPNGNGNTNCTPTPGGSDNYDVVSDGIVEPTTGDTSDYVSCGVGISDSYNFSDFNNVSTTTQIDVWAYYKNNSENEVFEVELWNSDESSQYSTTAELANSTIDTWNKVTFSDLNLSQSELHGLRIKYTNTLTGGSGSGSILYSTYADIIYTKANQPPTITNLQLNGNNDITLQANTTTEINVTATIDDPYGYEDISNVGAKLFRSGVDGMENCSFDDSNCYQNTSCQLQNCSGTSCDAVCPFDIQFFADPTDEGTPWSSEYWQVWLEAEDSLSQIDSDYSAPSTTEISSLSSITLQDGNLDFGTLSPGQTTDPLTAVTEIISTGNTSLDIIIYGENLTDPSQPGKSINVGQITFAATSNTPYASSTPLQTNPGIELEMGIRKTQDIEFKEHALIWWGFQAPIPAPSGNFSGSITYSTVVNELPWEPYE